MRIQGDLSLYYLIHKLKHRYQILSHLKRVSISRFRISVAGLLGVAGLILAVRDSKTGNFLSLPWFSERKDSSEKLYFVAGLQNLGNNCFLNVILQALASCSCFHDFLQNIIEENGSWLFEEQVPFTVSLAALLKELCILRDGRMVLSPRKVMVAMDAYIPSFSLTSQQDAAEAFLHLLSSLKEEFSECYVPSYSSLADISAFSIRSISIPNRRESPNERERWQHLFLGPFDGILGSILTCKSCSFQLSMDFEFFHSLPLPLVPDSSTTNMDGCSVEDCLKRFTVAECIDNYRCDRCWHISAMNYLSSIEGTETQVEKLRCCSEQDSCECRSLFRQEAFPWSNTSSHTFKQLSITRCPKILCLHLQRASMNEFGELVKLQGHISFPLILDLFPYTKDAVGLGIESSGENVQRMQAKQQHHSPIPCLNHFNMQLDTRMLQRVYGLAGENISSGALVGEKLGCSVFNPLGDTDTQALEEQPGFPHSEGGSDSTFTGMHPQSDDKVGMTCGLEPSMSYMYSLVSVVEHFGRAGSGHYMVHRRVRAEFDNEDSSGRFEPARVHWFCVSDSEVSSVSEKDVLAAEASLLFYERIMGPK